MRRRPLIYLTVFAGLGVVSGYLLMLSQSRDLDRLAESRQVVAKMLQIHAHSQCDILTGQLRTDYQNSAIATDCLRLAQLSTDLESLVPKLSSTVANQVTPVVHLVNEQSASEERLVSSFLTISIAYRNSLAYIETTSANLIEMASNSGGRDLAYDVLLLRSETTKRLAESSLGDVMPEDFVSLPSLLRWHRLFPELDGQLSMLESHARKALELGPRVQNHLEKLLASPFPDTLRLADEIIASSIAEETERVQFATKGFASLVAALIAFVATLLWELSKQAMLLRLANSTLEEKVLAKVKEIREYEQAMVQSQKLESIGQLAAGIAHEINTPMQSISSNIEFLKTCCHRLILVVDGFRQQLFSDRLASRDERREAMTRLFNEQRFDYACEQTPAAIDEVAEATQRVIDIVRAMKTMSHPGAKEKVATDVNELVRSALTVSKCRWKCSSELALELEAGLPAIEGLPAALSQVFLNLIVNAADAIVEKNGETSSSLGKITVRTRSDGDGIRIDVSDDGCGIPDNVKLKVFDPFFTTKDVGKGTGQGLAITYDIIVMKHGGRISIESKVGLGTTFSVWLPCEGTLAEFTPEETLVDQQADRVA